jgi:hypothetical protein
MQPARTCKIFLFFLSSLMVLISVIAYYKNENFVVKHKELDSWYSNRVGNMIRLQMKVAHQCGTEIDTNYETNNIINGSKPLSFYIIERDSSLLVLRIPQKYCSECNDELYNIMLLFSAKLLNKTLIIVPKHLHRDFYAKFIGSGYEHRIVSVPNQFHSFDIIDEINPYFFTIKHNNITSSYFIFNRNEVEQTKQYLISYLMTSSNRL